MTTATSHNALLRDLQRELAALERDLLTRAGAPETQASFRAEYDEAFRRERTAAPYEEWLDDQVTQSAVAWLLACVFVRFCEDNRLVDQVWLAGPGDRRAEAADAQLAYFGRHPTHNDRDWLLHAFEHFADLPATAGIFDREHNPLWRLRPSGDAATRLVTFWRRTTPEGDLVHSFASPDLDTRFLGDLYQDLSESARKRYALLQTPEFVEEFILDRTLERAIEERGVEGLKLIDPTCGSGHFLLGAFKRLLDRWATEAPGMDIRERVQLALSSIYGVDLNPFAVAIARFRLTVAALRASGLNRLKDAPAFDYHLAVGDSLLHGGIEQVVPGMEQWDKDSHVSGFAYAAEELDKLKEILQPQQYDVVVGNPPYILVRDKALNEHYRTIYKRTCKGRYALSVPFCERFFGLARRPDEHGRNAGWVGQITANSFMKREFGRKLVENFLPTVNLVEIFDTSGAYIPGHGTPTAILIGQHRPPARSPVRAVLGARGEPSTPENPAKGLVWTAIRRIIDGQDDRSLFVSLIELSRERLATHPWAFAGGGAAECKASIDAAKSTELRHHLEGKIGFASFPGQDEPFFLNESWFQRVGDQHHLGRRLVAGEVVRDWEIRPEIIALVPYDREQHPIPFDNSVRWSRHLWQYRTTLKSTTGFGKVTRGDTTDPWWTWYRWVGDRYRNPLSITFAFVATHNHFVLDRGGKVFNRSAPVIKLPEDATEDDHLRLLGLLNSSTACFWLKQVSYNKGSTVDIHGARQTTVDWENFYEFTGTKLEYFPLPDGAPIARARRLDGLAGELQATTPAAVCSAGTPSRQVLDDARKRWEAIRSEMIAVQEELDWEVYRLYRLLEEEVVYDEDDLPSIAFGERAFEIALARRIAAGEEDTAWFARHSATPRTDLPAHWPAAYKELVNRRIQLIEERPDLALIERPECKRRWAVTPWEQQERDALRGWLLDRLEAPELWVTDGRPRVRTVRQLADAVREDEDFLSVLALYVGHRDYDLVGELEKLTAPEAVPYLAALRYTESGMRKRRQWEAVWELQRREDAGEPPEKIGKIPVPPKYTSADFAKPSYWRHRGKLDVPKERFISYPGAERDVSPSPVLGWAGWDHLQQALAVATLVIERSTDDGWEAGRLKPLLAGLLELEPWLHQWHTAYDPDYGDSPAAWLSGRLDQWLGEHGLLRADLEAWRPERARRGRGRRGRA